VHADQKRLGQILINLLSNAIKYTQQGSVSLVIRYRAQIAEFEIADTGPGIGRADLDKIFEPFERGSDRSILSTPGTGLGLTITKLLTHIMGGEVRVQSSSVSGSVFVVRLLLSDLRHEVELPPPLRRICDYVGPRQRILLIDDDPLHLELVQNLLRPLGFTLFIARDGKTGLELAGQCQPDLAMVDLSLPDISGWNVMRELRTHDTLAGTKIMIVSASAHEYSARKGEGYDSFLMKPVHLQRLLDEIGALLNLKWIDQPEPSEESARALEVALPGVALGRSRHHLDDLYRLGQIGHVRGIEAKLRELELEDPANDALASQLRVLISSFDLKRYMSVLGAMRAEG
jgi:DNA-binding response OmpR family regulator/anti-sigma regulatory factor (Ser/Thr protein kinase)